MRRSLSFPLIAVLAVAVASCSFTPGIRSGMGGAGSKRAPGGPVQIIVWSSRPLPQALLEAAKQIPGVLATGTRRTGLVDLLATAGATLPLPLRPAGTVVPVSVTTLTDGLVGAF
ncbi:MAG: hypothetical protein ACRDJM_06665, partial [Actinomycetota bacterium]